MRRAKLIAVRPWNLRRIALHAVEFAVNPVVLIDKRPVSDLTERGPVTRRGLRRCIDFEVRDDADPILGFHDHPSQMWVADRFAHVAKHCAEQGWLKIEGDPSQQADAMD